MKNDEWKPDIDHCAVASIELRGEAWRLGGSWLYRLSRTPMCLAVIFVLAGQTVALSQVRTWTNTKGDTVEAAFESMENGQVLLVRSNGSRVRIEMKSLIDEDVEYIATECPSGKVLHVMLDSNFRVPNGFTRPVLMVRAHVSPSWIAANVTVSADCLYEVLRKRSKQDGLITATWKEKGYQVSKWSTQFGNLLDGSGVQDPNASEMLTHLGVGVGRTAAKKNNALAGYDANNKKLVGYRVELIVGEKVLSHWLYEDRRDIERLMEKYDLPESWWVPKISYLPQVTPPF